MSHSKAISCLIAVSLLLASIVPCYASSSIIKPDAAYADSFVHEQIRETVRLVSDGDDLRAVSTPTGVSESGAAGPATSATDDATDLSGFVPAREGTEQFSELHLDSSDLDSHSGDVASSTRDGLSDNDSPGCDSISELDPEDHISAQALPAVIPAAAAFALDVADLAWQFLMYKLDPNYPTEKDYLAGIFKASILYGTITADSLTFIPSWPVSNDGYAYWSDVYSYTDGDTTYKWTTGSDHPVTWLLTLILQEIHEISDTLQPIRDQSYNLEKMLFALQGIQDSINALYNEDGYLSTIVKNQAAAANQLLQGMNNYTGIITGYLSTLIDNQGVINSNMLLGLNGIKNQLGFGGTIDGVASFRSLFLSQTGSLISLLQDIYYGQESGFDLTIELLYDIIDALANLSPGNITVDNASVVTAVNNLLNQFLNTGSINGIPTFTHRMQTWVQTIVDAILSTDGNGEVTVDGTPIVTAINQLWNQLGSSSTIDGVDTFRKAYDQNALYGQTALAKLISILGDESKTTITYGESYYIQPMYLRQADWSDNYVADLLRGDNPQQLYLTVDRGDCEHYAFPHAWSGNCYVQNATLTLNYYSSSDTRSYDYPLGYDGECFDSHFGNLAFIDDGSSADCSPWSLLVLLVDFDDLGARVLAQQRLSFVVTMECTNGYEDATIVTEEYFVGDGAPAYRYIDTSTTVTKQVTVLGMLADLLEAIRKIQSSSSSTVVPNIDLTIDTSALEGKLDTIIGLMALSGVEDLLDDFIGDFDLDTSSLLVGQIQTAVQNAFPFCIPAILKQVLGLLDAPASIAPVDFDLFGAELHLDFEAFGIIAFGDVTKWICRIGFCVVLLVNTRRFIFTLNGGASDG